MDVVLSKPHPDRNSFSAFITHMASGQSTNSPPPLVLLPASSSPPLQLAPLISQSPIPIPINLSLRNNTCLEQLITFKLSSGLTSSLAILPYAPLPSYPLQHLDQLHLYSPTSPLAIPPTTTRLLTLYLLSHSSADDLHTVHGHLQAVCSTFTAVLALSATLIRSVIQPSVTRLNFPYTSQQDTAFVPFSVRNLSPIPTSFTLSSATPTHAPTFRRPDGSPVVSPIPISASDTVLLHVSMPSPIPPHLAFSILNVNDPSNIAYVSIFESTSTSDSDCGLRIDCGTELDFADCYAGCRTFRDVEIANASDETMSITITSDRKNQISFELLQDWGKASRGGKELDISALRKKYSLHEVFERSRSPISRRASLGIARGIDEEVVNGLLGRTSGGLFAPLGNVPGVGVTHVGRGGKARSEELLLLETGQSRKVRVWFVPMVTEARLASELDRGRLVADSFSLTFKTQERRKLKVAARARVCESILQLERAGVDMGDCNVLTQYWSQLTLINCSDLPAIANLEYVSQCVTAEEHEVSIAPRETIEVKLSFVPRQVNPNYHKEIAVINNRNSLRPNQVFRLIANCVDNQGISLHALFYKILAPNPTNEIDFGVTVANHPAIRSFRVRNITKGNLTLRLTAGKGVRTFLPTKFVPNKSSGSKPSIQSHKFVAYRDPVEQKINENNEDSPWDCPKWVTLQSVNALTDKILSEHDIERLKSFDLKKPFNIPRDICEIKGGNSEQQSNTQEAYENDYGDREVNDRELVTLSGEKCWTAFLKCLNERDFSLLNSVPAFFSNPSSELSYAEQQFRPARRLKAALRDGYLQETDTVELKPGAECLVVLSLVLTDKDVRNRTKMRNFERQLIVNILEFDNARITDAAPTSSRALNVIAKEFENGRKSMPRAIILTVQACKSRMCISPLQQLNFGNITPGEQKDKVFTIVNLSDVPLLYSVKKAKGDGNDLRFNLGKGTEGVVRGYSTKVVPFIYAPTKEGAFEEMIIIENRLDKSSNCGLVVKAMVC